MTILFTNNASTSLASGITSGATSLTVATGQGALFPTITGSNIFYLTLQNQAGTTPIEIVKVTARSGDTMTIVRGQDNTTASAFNAGDKVELRLPAVVLQDFPQLDVSNTFTVDQSISGLTVGKGGGGVSSNAVLGVSAAPSNTTGRVTAIGYQSLYTNSTGDLNTAVGYQASYLNTTGGGNSSFGIQALYSNTTGGTNAAFGYGALYSNTTASNNTAVGYQAGYTNTTGTLLTAVGQGAAYHNTTGANITAIGSGALTTNTTGSYNTAVGTQDSTGYSALGANSTGSYNISVGNGALGNNTTASYNTAVGYQAGYTQSGSNAVANTFIGYQAGQVVTTGQINTFVGFAAGNTITTGSKNTILGGYNGNQGGLDIRTASNYIVLSDGDGNPRLYSDGSGKWTFGASTSNFNTSYIFLNNASTGNWAQTISDSYAGAQAFMSFNYGSTQIGKITGNNSATTYSTSSDYRLKENIVPMTDALKKVAQLKPVTYDWKAGGSSQGFIAHELAEVCPDAVVGEKDAVNEDGSIKPQGIDTSFLVATLTAAIQEQQALITDLQARLTKAGL